MRELGAMLLVRRFSAGCFDKAIQNRCGRWEIFLSRQGGAGTDGDDCEFVHFPA